ncbi:MAG: tRNA (adenosine(37)-N6)-threonylcarbamoyltransferase complex ATPase subunit type 1 TsaE [Actinomycetota bacterium]
MLELRSGTAQDTRAIGRALAAALRAGDTTILTGELGAGKTTLVRGIADGLGSEDPVASPTFTLIREYGGGRLDVVHVDVFRLSRMQDVVDLGLDELRDTGRAVLLVEWGDAIVELLPDDHLRVELSTPDPGSEDRRVVLSASGPSWADRWERLEHALAAWTAAA